MPALRRLGHGAIDRAMPVRDERSIRLKEGRPGLVEARGARAVGLDVGVVGGVPVGGFVEFAAVEEVDSVWGGWSGLVLQDVAGRASAS